MGAEELGVDAVTDTHGGALGVICSGGYVGGRSKRRPYEEEKRVKLGLRFRISKGKG